MDKSTFIKRHLTTLIMIAVYLLIAVFHILSDSFQSDRQISLILAMIPFILYGVCLDFAMSHSTEVEPFYLIISKILPVGVFIIQIINSIYINKTNESSQLLGIALWIFLALPFFIACYTKVNFRSDLIRSLVISGILFIIYGYLSTQTENLYTDSGVILYYITFVFIFYVVSQFKIFPYSSILLGIINALVLLSFRFFTITQDTKLYGWDYNLLFRFELLLITNLVVALITRMLYLINKK